MTLMAFLAFALNIHSMHLIMTMSFLPVLLAVHLRMMTTMTYRIFHALSSILANQKCFHDNLDDRMKVFLLQTLDPSLKLALVLCSIFLNQSESFLPLWLLQKSKSKLCHHFHFLDTVPLGYNLLFRVAFQSFFPHCYVLILNPLFLKLHQVRKPTVLV